MIIVTALPNGVRVPHTHKTYSVACYGVVAVKKLEVCTKPTHTPPDDAISVMWTLVETESTIPATFHTCADVCCSLKCGGHVDKSVWSQQIGDNDEIYVSWTSHGNSTFNICESPLRSM